MKTIAQSCASIEAHRNKWHGKKEILVQRVHPKLSRSPAVTESGTNLIQLPLATARVQDV